MKVYLKTIHLSIMFLLACILAVLLIQSASAQNDLTLQYGSKPQTPKDTPEQLHKKLVNARDAISNIMGSKMGTIPFNEVGIDEINSTLDVGIDSSKATLSEEQYLKKIKEIVGDVPIKITFGQISNLILILPNHSIHSNNTSASILSPLKQFTSGIKPEYVKCDHNLHLIIKAEDGSFACVTIETGKNLAMRGWATTFGTGISTNDYYTKCDTLYPQSDTGVAVFYMHTNSIGKICVRYHNLNNTPTGIGIRIFEANNMTQNASNVTAWTEDSTLEGNANKTIVYFIKTGTKAGFYGISLNCGGFPLAVGYDANSTITASDFPWIGQSFHCGAITYESHMEGTAGISVKYIPYP